MAQRRDGTRLSNLVREMALHDWMVFAFLTFLNIAVLRAPDRPIKTQCLLEVAGLLAVFLVVAVLVVDLFRTDWREKAPPGPVPARRPVRDAESRALRWVSTTVLLVALAAVVVERVVVLA